MADCLWYSSSTDNTSPQIRYVVGSCWKQRCVCTATWNSVAEADADADESNCPSQTTDDDADDDDDGMSSGGSLELEHCVTHNTPDITRNVNMPHQPRSLQSHHGVLVIVYCL